MLMTELAMMDSGPAGNSILSRSLRAIAHFFGFGEPPVRVMLHQNTSPVVRENPTEPILRIVPAPGGTIDPSVGTFRWRRHAQLLDRPTSPLPEEQRSARLHAVKGLYAARDGAMSAAERHFTIAAACPDIDLCEIPGFWQLSRSAMVTAVRAYETAGRLREASTLNARIRMLYRPRAVSALPTNITELPARRIGLTSIS